MRLATCMWGGAMCPLIPVMKRTPTIWRKEPFARSKPREISRGYAAFFEPDIFVETADGQFTALGLQLPARWTDAAKRFRKFHELIRQDSGMDPEFDLGIGMTRIYRHLHRTEFQYVKRTEPEILHFAGGDEIGRAFFETCYGLFPEDASLAYIPDHYRRALNAKDVAPDLDSWLALHTGGAACPLHFTTRGADATFENQKDPTVFIFDPLNPADVIDAWNFKLYTRDVLYVNSRWLESSRALVGEYIKHNYRPLPQNHNGVMIGTTVHVARSLDYENVAADLRLGELSLGGQSLSAQTGYDPIWMEREDDETFHPVAGILRAKRRDVQLVPAGDRNFTMPVPVLSPAFAGTQRGLLRFGQSVRRSVAVRRVQRARGLSGWLPCRVVPD